MGKLNITVLGSMNIDLAVNCKRIPHPGETIIGTKLTRHYGGKGANQAVAIARLGGKPKFLGARGNDQEGKEFENYLINNKVNTNLKVCSTKTGTANIIVTSDGENYIIVIPGANGEITPDDIIKLSESLISTDILLLQLEIPLSSVVKAGEIAFNAGAKIILDPAPAVKLPDCLLEKIDFLLPNQEELKQLTPDYNNTNDRVRAEYLIDKGVKNVIITCGEKGVKFYNNDKEMLEISAPNVNVSDTTGAGDAFAGAFALGISKGLSIKEAIELGVIYGSAATTKPGAQSSFLNREEAVKVNPKLSRLL